MKGFVWIVIGIIVVVSVVRCVRIVPQAQCWITEFFGKYKSSWGPGLHIKIPFFEHVVNKVSLKERALDFQPQGVITKDNIIMAIDPVVFMTVTDAKLYTYGVEDPIIAVQLLALTTLRNIIGTLGLDDCLSARDQINAEMTKILDAATDPWGIRISRVEVKSIQPPKDISDAMAKQMKSDRERRAAQIEAEAHKVAVVTRAEGDKDAAILRAQAQHEAAIELAKGQAESLELVYRAEAEGLRQLAAVKISPELLGLKSINAMKDIADGNATKIIIPAEMSRIASMASVFSEISGIGSAMPVASKSEDVVSHVDECCDDDDRTAVTKELTQEGGNE